MRLFTLCFLVLAAACTAALVNYTIDDKYGDSSTGIHPTYLPWGAWENGDTCDSCGLYPANLGHVPAGSLTGAAVDPAQAFNGTWHDTTYLYGGSPRNITVQFVGQAVYVFNIIANTVPFTSTNTTLVFSLDAEIVGHYTHTPDPSGPELMYKVAVYANHSLPYGNHTLVISAGGTNTSLILFDYVVYTADDLVPALPPAHITAVQNSSYPTATNTSSYPTAVQTPLFTDTPLPQTPSIITSSVLQWTSPQSPFVSATSSPQPHWKSAIIMGSTAAGSALGTVLLGLVAIFIRRKCKRRARKTQAHCSSPNTIPAARLDTTTVPTSFSLHAHAMHPPSSSDGFSRAATRPSSRRTRSLSDITALSTSSPPTDRYSARVRLFAKIVDKSHPRVYHPVGPREHTAPPVTTGSLLAGSHEAAVRGRTDGPERAGLSSAPSGRGGGLRAEVAGLRKEIELFRETELAIYGVPVWVPPPYRRGEGTAPGPRVETQLNLATP